ncbi:hypothetical protein [Nostoc sp. C110]|uniref:hypothetical protein n=1 Tax=Nostoc sp. C110 TaxID=3349876 RepID=UPI00370D2583
MNAYRQNSPVIAKILETQKSFVQATFWRCNDQVKIELVAVEEEFRSQNSGVRINQSGIQTRD